MDARMKTATWRRPAGAGQGSQLLRWGWSGDSQGRSLCQVKTEQRTERSEALAWLKFSGSRFQTEGATHVKVLVAEWKSKAVRVAGGESEENGRRLDKKSISYETRISRNGPMLSLPVVPTSVFAGERPGCRTWGLTSLIRAGHLSLVPGLHQPTSSAWLLPRASP